MVRGDILRSAVRVGPSLVSGPMAGVGWQGLFAKRALSTIKLVALQLFATGLVVMHSIARLQAEPSTPQNTPPVELGAFGSRPLNAFEQSLVLESLKGLVFALIVAGIVAAAAFFTNKAMERFKNREALLSEYKKKRIEKIISAWDILNKFDAAWSRLIVEKRKIKLSLTDGKRVAKLRPKTHDELTLLEREIQDFKAQAERAIDYEPLWLGRLAKQELKKFYNLLVRLMRVDEVQVSRYDEFDKSVSTLSRIERGKKFLEWNKAQAPLNNEAKRLRAEIEAFKTDLLDTIRRIDAESA